MKRSTGERQTDKSNPNWMRVKGHVFFSKYLTVSPSKLLQFASFYCENTAEDDFSLMHTLHQTQGEYMCSRNKNKGYYVDVIRQQLEAMLEQCYELEAIVN